MSQIVKLVHKALKENDFREFLQIISPLKNDINQYVFSDEDSDTNMNLLHIMSALNPGNISEHTIRSFINLMIDVDSGFDLNYRATVEHCFNMTAAHIAVQWKNIPMLSVLISFNCDLFICDSHGKNVQDYAEALVDDHHDKYSYKVKELIKQAIYQSIEKRLNQQFQQQTEEVDDFFMPSDEARNFFDNHSNHSPSIEDHVQKMNSLSTSLSNSLNTNTTGLLSISPNTSTSGYAKSPPTINASCTNDSIRSPSADCGSFEAVPCLISSFDDEKKDSNVNNNGNRGLQHVSATTLISSSDPSFDSQSTHTVYKDNQFELIEERYHPVDLQVTILDQNADVSSDSFNAHSHDDSKESHNSAVSIATTIDSFILKMNDQELSDKLHKHGFDAGPINDDTRKYYQRKYYLYNKENENLVKQDEELENHNQEWLAKIANYNIEFTSIRTFPFEEAIQYEQMLIQQFQNYDHETNGQKKQTYFVYLLLDPTITENIPVQVNFRFWSNFSNINNNCKNADGQHASIFGDVLNDYSLFYRFITAIFYVGKGQSNRPYQHFVDAHRELKQQQLNGKTRKPLSAKTKRINSIWDQGLGPISIHFFSGITSDEAYTREALLIETISLFNLTNQIAGSYRFGNDNNQFKRLNKRQKNILGTYLLFKFFITYLLNGERQIKMFN